MSGYCGLSYPEEMLGPYESIVPRVAMTDDRAYELHKRRQINQWQASALQGAYSHSSANFGPSQSLWKMLWS